MAEKTLSQEAAREVMETQPYAGGRILYEGEWREVCRTDWKDDTRTAIVSHPDPLFGTREFWLKRNILGARVTDRAFFIIDSLSDG
jgi:hypothetical protein